MKSNCFILLTLLALSAPAAAQDTNNFDAYRQNMLDRFYRYKEGVLADYATYLKGVWERFETFKGIKRQETPKPKVLPKGYDEPVTNPVTTVPQEQPEPEVQPSPQPVDRPKQATSPTPSTPVDPPVRMEQIPFSFYGITLKGPKAEFPPLPSLDKQHLSSAWTAYQKRSAKEVVPSLGNMVQNMHLNDWLTVDMVRHYADKLLASHSGSDRILLQHTILTTMGYDVRLAKTDEELLLLIPFTQMIYERPFIEMNGHKYFTFKDSKSPSTESLKPIYTCKIAADVDAGRYVNPLISGGIIIQHTGTDHPCVLNYQDITIKTIVNTPVMEMFRHYPQMDIPCYAKSSILPLLREDLLKQFRPYIAHLSKPDAARKLLHFIQHAFQYATDGDQHGYEKSYFVEENFYYPKNDCEDRSILFAFLVRNLLGLDVHLVQYPGHECTAVCFNDPTVQGDGYIYQQKRYIICDPTYIGAGIGMCMPKYRSEKPKIQLW